MAPRARPAHAVTRVAEPNWLDATTVADGWVALIAQPRKCQVGFVIGNLPVGTSFKAGLQCRLAAPIAGTNPFGASELTSLIPVGTLKPLVALAT